MARNRDIAKARDVIGYLAGKLGAASLSEVATYFQCYVANLSRQLGEIEKQAASPPEMKDRKTKYLDAITQAGPLFLMNVGWPTMRQPMCPLCSLANCSET